LSRLGIAHIFGGITRIVRIFTNVVVGTKAKSVSEAVQRDAEAIDSSGSRRYVYCAVHINGMVCYERGSSGIKIL